MLGKKTLLAVSALALLVAGCSALPPDTAFHGEPGKGFVVVAVEGAWQNSDAKFFLVLRRLNVTNDGFIKPKVVAYFTGKSDFPDDEFAKPKSTNPAIRLAGLHLVPGDYAIVSLILDGFGTGGGTTFFHCYALGSPVYHIKEGVVNLVHFNANYNQPGLNPDAVKSDVVKTLATYPNITAPLDISMSMGSVSFTSSTNILGNPTCEPDGRLTFIQPPVPMGSAAE